ncbi:Glutaredoxin-2, mitochondrial [Lemmus lemmus]
MSANYKVVELDMLEYGVQFQDILPKIIGERTVPSIFVIGMFIGGATDLQRLHEEGKLLMWDFPLYAVNMFYYHLIP